MKRNDPTKKETTTFIKPHVTKTILATVYSIWAALCNGVNFIALAPIPHNALKMVIKAQNFGFCQFQMVVM